MNKLRGDPTRAKLTKSTSLTGPEQSKGRKKRLSPSDRKRSMADDEFKEQRADNREKLPKQGRKHPKRKKNSPKLVLQGTLQGEESPEKRIKSPSSGLSTQTVLTGLPIDNKPFDFSPTGVEAWTDSNKAPNQDPENDPGSNIQHEPTPAFSIHPGRILLLQSFYLEKKNILKEMRKKTFPFYLKLGGESCISNETLNPKLKEI